MTDRTTASFGTLVFMIVTALLIGAFIWLGHLQYMMGST